MAEHSGGAHTAPLPQRDWYSLKLLPSAGAMRRTHRSATAAAAFEGKAGCRTLYNEVASFVGPFLSNSSAYERASFAAPHCASCRMTMLRNKFLGHALSTEVTYDAAGAGR
jgi:hypothetical protein